MNASQRADLRAAVRQVVATIDSIHHAELASAERLLHHLDSATGTDELLPDIQHVTALLSRSPDDRFIVALAHLNVLAEALSGDDAL